MATPLHTTGLQLHGIMGVRTFGSALCLQQPVCLGMLCGNSYHGGLWETTVKGHGFKSSPGMKLHL